MSEIINTEAGCRCNKDGWAFINFEEAIIKVKYPSKIKTKDFLPIGKYAIISQEEEFISGYSNDKDKVFEVSKPVVIFGDHTRNLKYVNFNFVIGADGVKILLPIKQLESKFFYYYLKHQDIPSLGYSRHYKLLKELIIKYPPLSEQQRIVSELDCLNRIIEKQKEQLKQLDELAQSIFYDMFGDPVENEKGWKVYSLKELTSKIGSGATPKGGNESYKDDGISLIRSLNVHNNLFKEKDLAFIDEIQADGLKNVVVQKSDVLLNITGASVARCCIVPEHILPARVNQHVAILRPLQERLNSYFLNFLLTSSTYQQLLLSQSKSNGATREALTKTQLQNLLIACPPLSLQQQFASKIEAIEHQRELIKKSIAETETLFNSRMDYYFG